jgi:hypothetical protein
MPPSAKSSAETFALDGSVAAALPAEPTRATA